MSNRKQIQIRIERASDAPVFIAWSPNLSSIFTKISLCLEAETEAKLRSEVEIGLEDLLEAGGYQERLKDIDLIYTYR